MSTSFSSMELATGDLGSELATTRRMLERLPDDHFDWKPHEKSMSVGALATHIINLLPWQKIIVETEELDLSASPLPREKPENRDAVLRLFDEWAEELKAVVAQADEAMLGETWTFRNGEYVIFSMPKAKALRVFGISHLVHHRAQLGVYFRLLDVPLPYVYGPSADER